MQLAKHALCVYICQQTKYPVTDANKEGRGRGEKRGDKIIEASHHQQQQ